MRFLADMGVAQRIVECRQVSVILFRLHNTRTAFVMDRLRKVLRDAGQALEEGPLSLWKSAATESGGCSIVDYPIE